jgi:hypothetical protein
MAEHQLIPRQDRIQAEARDTDWATLVARAVDDLTRILQSEGRLVVAGIRTVLNEEIERLFAFIATSVLMAGGGTCILAAAILFLHEFVLLAWWASFGIVGLALFGIGVALGAFATSSPKPPPLT